MMIEYLHMMGDYLHWMWWIFANVQWIFAHAERIFALAVVNICSRWLNICTWWENICTGCGEYLQMFSEYLHMLREYLHWLWWIFAHDDWIFAHAERIFALAVVNICTCWVNICPCKIINFRTLWIIDLTIQGGYCNIDITVPITLFNILEIISVQNVKLQNKKKINSSVVNIYEEQRIFSRSKVYISGIFSLGFLHHVSKDLHRYRHLFSQMLFFCFFAKI